jgi:hypothetical protein
MAHCITHMGRLGPVSPAAGAGRIRSTPGDDRDRYVDRSLLGKADRTRFDLADSEKMLID